MTGSVRQPHFLQPVQGLLLCIPPAITSHPQRHGDVLDCGELGKQIVKLPDKSEFPASKLRRCLFRELSQIEFGEVYVTTRRGIKDSEDVQ